MISKVDLHDFWEITKALYGNGGTSEAEPIVVRLLVDAVSTGTVATPPPADGAVATPESVIGA
jgi:hypothetical protein